MWSVELKITAPASEIFRRLGRREGAFWIDRTSAGGASFMSFAPTAQLFIDEHARATRVDSTGRTSAAEDPATALADFVREAEPLESRHACPRTAGYLGYDLGPTMEPHLAARRSASSAVPLAYLARYDAVASCVPMDDAPDPLCRVFVDATCEASAAALIAAITDEGTDRAADAALGADLLEAPSWPEYRSAVTRALDYIASGDVYQVNLARRFRVGCPTAPSDAYLALRAAQPVPYGFFLDCGDFSVLSNSPERFLQVRGRSIRTEPIKGTRRRHPTANVDRELAVDLLGDPKEQAEHVMIVDLERNDLGRIAEEGTVRVTSLLRLESFATLHHLVSNVEARLPADVDLPSILRATFPGGSITGAPKIRATEVIAELEPHGRGVYTGSLVWFRSETDFDSSIAIRTAVARDGIFSYYAGGGIVADSDPRREWEECWLKARAFLSALFGPDVAERLARESTSTSAERTTREGATDATRSVG